MALNVSFQSKGEEFDKVLTSFGFDPAHGVKDRKPLQFELEVLQKSDAFTAA